MTSNDEHHVALPKLYGAPAYARPPAPVAHTMRPLDPDDLPIEAERTPEEARLAREVTAHPYRGAAPADPIRSAGGRAILPARPFRLRALTDRFRGGNGGRP